MKSRDYFEAFFDQLEETVEDINFNRQATEAVFSQVLEILPKNSDKFAKAIFLGHLLDKNKPVYTEQLKLKFKDVTLRKELAIPKELESDGEKIKISECTRYPNPKNDMIYFEATPRQHKWNDKDTGEPRSRIVFRIDNFKFLSRKNEVSDNTESYNDSNEEDPTF